MRPIQVLGLLIAIGATIVLCVHLGIGPAFSLLLSTGSLLLTIVIEIIKALN